MTDPRSTLTELELAEVRTLAEAQIQAHAGKDYAVADVLRTTLMEWGAWPPKEGWHPVFESKAHRMARLERRAA